mmetsp:Transcript_612/g.846  ORF Transcript_612/g.846 Transcript_612/m.846 type:complete len:326 (+) Transcript_612:77-1054(+)|eukprot:CAMPEP_0206450000 /NCGR_PEP_ID=MMETSP0324_2-20121206/18447_1 /ASSEMBLY_ACC=CAM_ASM_000836 /TAXON_ID=2866 /ORGANISM="Crypthecodinium cohnii, Strain Seligo" /LENGTH=325 /DNA_ID=CAMNT_0053919531 /DNA_START=57 /DNA_END=1034 /DNA_ORIENTATION=-
MAGRMQDDGSSSHLLGVDDLETSGGESLEAEDEAKVFSRTPGRRSLLLFGGLAAVATLVFAGKSAPARGFGGVGAELGNVVRLNEGKPSLIKWQANLDLCLDVWGDKAGAMLQLFHCEDFAGEHVKSESELKWLVPEVGKEGYIQWAANTSLCLDAPEHGEIQLWYCATSPREHIIWKIDETGRIHLVHSENKCLDIKKTSALKQGAINRLDGDKIDLVDCVEATSSHDIPTQHFATGPEDCKWSEWSEWSVCSVSCGGGQRFQSRSHQIPAAMGGKECEGDNFRPSEDSCNTDPCLNADGEAISTSTTATTTIAGGGRPWWQFR